MNPIQALGHNCTEMRSISEVMRSVNQSVTNDVSDVLEISSGILRTMITDVSGADPTEDIVKSTAKFKEVADSREKQFYDKWNNQISIVGGTITKMSKHLLEVRENFESFADVTRGKLLNLTNKYDKENQMKMSDIQTAYNAELNEMTKQGKLINEDLDKNLCNSIQEISKKYTVKLKETDVSIEQLQIYLAKIIHDKHDSKNMLANSRENEDKRFAIEHERITIFYKNLKEECEKNIILLTEQIQEAKNAISFSEKSMEERLLMLESQMNRRMFAAKKKRNDELLETNQEIEQLNMKINEKKNELEREKTKGEALLRCNKRNFNEQVINIQKETEVKVNSIRNSVATIYEPQIGEMQNEFNELLKQKGIEYDSFMKKQSEMNKEIEGELFVLNMTNQKETDFYRRKLTMAKKKLHQLREARDADVSNIHHIRQVSVGSILQKSDDKERERTGQIAEIMKLFDEQQARLSVMKRMNVASRNKIRAEEIQSLKEVHEKRKQSILKHFDEVLKKEVESKYSALEKEEKNELISYTESIENKMEEVKARSELLQMKLDGLVKMTQDRYQAMAYDNDMKLLGDVKKAASGQEVINLKERIVEEAKVVEKRKSTIDVETEELRESIGELKDNFERKIANFGHQFASTKQHLIYQKTIVEGRSEQLKTELQKQTVRLNELDNIASSRKFEADQFEANYINKRNEFEKDTRQHWQYELDSRRQQPDSLEVEMKKMRESMAAEIKELNYQLNTAKEKTLKISHYMLLVRQQKLEETHELKKIAWEEKSNILISEHQKRLSTIENEKKETIKEHKERISKMESEYKHIFTENEKLFNELVFDIQTEQEKAKAENIQFDNIIHELEHRECTDCQIAKDKVKLMLNKKMEMEKRMKMLRNENDQSEAQINYIFGRKNRVAPTPIPNSNYLHTKSATISPRIAKPKAASSMGIRVFI